ncbi:hypothetical protein CWO07_16725 [Vibrio splendidus]|uniref:Uncharacterized protein n=1 Tax=Vibrio splendidus TaxID=29497 RepID=A0A2N7EEA9_VIBSP|nr:hypothetical protein A147_20320 [Vibrio splendidus FF-6]PMI74686.1 hypothetical protein BCU38_14055 [Vibrio splendidus]PMP31668.1 hypothetical protein BCS88_17340 [Vibrio splendidus]PMP42879.1 hypothetical protein BCS87_05115 [Vibrio splendidus]PTP19094.1 hypothetical protein CWO36_11735 [Vibrio splendidus]
MLFDNMGFLFVYGLSKWNMKHIFINVHKSIKLPISCPRFIFFYNLSNGLISFSDCFCYFE